MEPWEIVSIVGLGVVAIALLVVIFYLWSRDAQDNSQQPTTRTTLLVGMCASLLVGLTTVLLLLERISGDGSTNLFFTAPTQIILGSLIVLLIFLIFVIGFRRMDLTDNEQALGLPQGSIRALIAVLLIVIFFIFTNVIFGTFASERSETSFGPIGQEQLDRLQSQEPNAVVTQEIDPDGAGGSEPTEFSGFIPGGVDESTEKLGLQLFTGLMTLVSTVTAFYFGSHSVRAATASALSVAATRGGNSATSISLLEPSGSPSLIERSAGALSPVMIKLNAPADLKEVKGDESASVVFVPSEGRFHYEPASPAPLVTLTFCRRDQPADMVTLALVPAPSTGDDTDTNTGDTDTDTGDTDTNTGDTDTNTGDTDTNTGDTDTNTGDTDTDTDTDTNNDDDTGTDTGTGDSGTDSGDTDTDPGDTNTDAGDTNTDPDTGDTNTDPDTGDANTNTDPDTGDTNTDTGDTNTDPGDTDTDPGDTDTDPGDTDPGDTDPGDTDPGDTDTDPGDTDTDPGDTNTNAGDRNTVTDTGDTGTFTGDTDGESAEGTETV